MPPQGTTPTVVADYREELMLSLSLARESALENICKAPAGPSTTGNRASHAIVLEIGC